jgi:hypothetical protein
MGPDQKESRQSENNDIVLGWEVSPVQSRFFQHITYTLVSSFLPMLRLPTAIPLHYSVVSKCSYILPFKSFFNFRI